MSLPRKIRLAAEILSAYAVVRWHLWRREFPEALAAVRSPASRAGDAHTGTVDAGLRLGNAVMRTLSPLPADSRCLVRSLVLVRLLARRGLPATLVLGASNTDGFEAHAWVEQDGRAVLPTGGGRFERLAEL